MFPVLLIIAYLTVRRGLRHFVSCVFIFVLAAGAYQWHRYEIFDMRHHQTTASGKGMQILYSEYLYLGDFGYRLSPDIGPNTKLLLTKIQEALQPSVQELALVKANIGQSTPDFLKKHVYPYTSAELFEKICTQPNEEYYWDFLMVAYNDQFFFNVAMEIARAYPLYIVKYATRTSARPFRSRLRDHPLQRAGLHSHRERFHSGIPSRAPTSLRIRSRNMVPARRARWNIFH